MENTKENNITNFQTEKEKRRGPERFEEQKSFDQCMEWGDYWSLPETEEFKKASEVVQYDMMGKALDKRIELNNKTFIELLRTDPMQAGNFLDNAIKPLRVVQQALIQQNASDQINKNPFAEDFAAEKKAA